MVIRKKKNKNVEVRKSKTMRKIRLNSHQDKKVNLLKGRMAYQNQNLRKEVRIKKKSRALPRRRRQKARKIVMT
jgi:hypothetical protein